MISRSTHEQNKSERYSKMLAVQDSEIAHKGHAVDMLKGLLQTSILVYGALFGLILQKGIDLTIVQFVGISTIFVNSYLASQIVKTTNEKIRQENIQYCLHYFEYRKERQILGLEDDLIESGFISESEKINRINDNSKTKEGNLSICKKLSLGQNAGHIYTQNILINFSRIITFVCIFGTLGLFLLSSNSWIMEKIYQIF